MAPARWPRGQLASRHVSKPFIRRDTRGSSRGQPQLQAGQSQQLISSIYAPSTRENGTRMGLIRRRVGPPIQGHVASAVARVPPASERRNSPDLRCAQLQRWRTPSDVSSSRFPARTRWSRSREPSLGQEATKSVRGKILPLAAPRKTGPPMNFYCAD